MVMTAKSYPVQRHVPVTINMEVPPLPGVVAGWRDINEALLCFYTVAIVHQIVLKFCLLI